MFNGTTLELFHVPSNQRNQTNKTNGIALHKFNKMIFYGDILCSFLQIANKTISQLRKLIKTTAQADRFRL